MLTTRSQIAVMGLAGGTQGLALQAGTTTTTATTIITDCEINPALCPTTCYV
jgi:hypothetical protein